MTNKILMPALSPTMTEGTLSKWLKKEGDKINPGDILAEIETDKATMEIESVDQGILTKILVSEGTKSVKVNSTIAILKSEDNDEEDKTVIQKNEEPLKKNIEEVENNKDSSNSNEVKKSDPLINSQKDISTYKNIKNISMREAINNAISEEMKKNKNVIIFGEEVGEYQGAYKVTQGLLKKFGNKRVIDTPISEEGFTGLAIGCAFNGLIPIVEYMTFNFSMQAIDQIVNTASKTHYMSGGQINVPIVFRGPNGAASQVAAQHSQDFTSWYAHCPGLKVITPSNAADAKGLLKSAIRDPNPVVFLENEILYSNTSNVPTNKDFTIPIGEAKIIKEGTDVTVIAFSISVIKSLEAIEILKKSNENISIELIDLRTIRPLDKETIINSVKKTNRVVCVEECWPFSGINAELSSIIIENAFDYLDAPVKRISSKDVPMPYALNLERECLPSVDDIINGIKEVCYK
tara:strand:+ start:5110 stop:6498 length:1389 start_codon:yes stop_codon:yes gene_type:complete